MRHKRYLGEGALLHGISKQKASLSEAVTKLVDSGFSEAKALWFQSAFCLFE